MSGDRYDTGGGDTCPLGQMFSSPCFLNETTQIYADISDETKKVFC